MIYGVKKGITEINLIKEPTTFQNKYRNWKFCNLLWFSLCFYTTQSTYDKVLGKESLQKKRKKFGEWESAGRDKTKKWLKNAFLHALFVTAPLSLSSLFAIFLLHSACVSLFVLVNK